MSFISIMCGVLALFWLVSALVAEQDSPAFWGRSILAHLWVILLYLSY